ncbi:PH domain-containing protein [Halomonas sp. M4R5S39]|uniref:PH domain-containing protein n=1 Tax=Halomonas kalidii TaxID=3043293 RepID=UPI0024A92E8E|nr:PH domain-containing protein [Halomonas kalidii]MDI5985511.1 PH domain-containing protein [Halomonas kalidii]
MTRDAAGDDGLAEWQRLSPWAIGLTLATTGVSLVREHLPLLLAAGAGLAVSDRVGLREALLGGGLLLVVALLLSLFYYRRFRFRFDADVLVIQKGLFVHREFKVAARHVQQTSVQQPAWMRPLGVVQWEVETPAGEAASIALPGIRRELAEALEARLVGAASRNGPTPAADETPSPVERFAITPGALVLHGLTSRSLVVIAALLSPLVRPLERWLHDRLPQLDPWAWLPASPPLAVGLGLVAALAALMLLAVLAAWWRFHGYVLRDDGERQVQVSGLLHRRSQTLTLRRLQVVEWVQTGPGRALGRGYLVCHQFGAMAGGEVAEARRFLVPGLTVARANTLVPSLWPGRGAAPSLTAPLQRVAGLYRRVLFLRLLLAMVAGVGLLAGVAGDGLAGLPAWSPGPVLVGLVALAAGLAHLRWRSLGWSCRGDWLRVRRGLWGQRTSLFPAAHLVSLQVQQSWLQRRRGVVTLRLYLASGRLSLPFVEERVALALANRLLASVEGLPDEGAATA